MYVLRNVCFIVMCLTSSLTHANDGYQYDGMGITTTDAYRQMLDHSCLSLIIFLEARGDGELSQLYHGMATINRALNPSRWKNDVCGVILQPSQYESIGVEEQAVVKRILKGDVYAADEYIQSKYTTPIYAKIWRRVTRVAYDLIRTRTLDNTWIDANHFYSLKSLQQRNLTTPSWIAEKTIVGIAGDTYFLK